MQGGRREGLSVLPTDPLLTRLSSSAQTNEKSRKNPKGTSAATMNRGNEPWRPVPLRTVPVMDAGRAHGPRGRGPFPAARGSNDWKPACDIPLPATLHTALLQHRYLYGANLLNALVQHNVFGEDENILWAWGRAGPRAGWKWRRGSRQVSVKCSGGQRREQAILFKEKRMGEHFRPGF